MKATKKEIGEKLLLAAQGDEQLRKFVVAVMGDLNEPHSMFTDPLNGGAFALAAFLTLGCLRVRDSNTVNRIASYTGEDLADLVEQPKEFYKNLWNGFVRAFQAALPAETEEFERLTRLLKAV
ncbi:MAG: hypothetical protein PHC70_02185 [Patescibacteria group bacterium]|nr:hypothetical protein [Patescibacteria group bacterium]